MALLKNNKLTERLGVQFRVSAFDVFNHPNFTLANLSVFPSNTNALNQGFTSLTSVPAGTFLNPQIFDRRQPPHRVRHKVIVLNRRPKHSAIWLGLMAPPRSQPRGQR